MDSLVSSTDLSLNFSIVYILDNIIEGSLRY